MNLNLSSVFNVSMLKEVYSSEVKEINSSKLIIIVLAFSLFALALFTGELVEYLVSVSVCVVAYRVYILYRDIMSIDLNFDSDDIELNKIIDELW